MQPKILLLRPEKQAQSYGQELEELGYAVFKEPILNIETVSKDVPDLHVFQAILITSINALHVLAEAVSDRDMPLYVVGPNTLAAAQRLGFSQIVSGKGRAEDLVGLVGRLRSPDNGPLLYVRGQDVAFDMRQALEKSGFDVKEHVAYAAIPKAALSETLISAIKDKQIQAIPFFSKRSAEAFFECAQAARLTPFLDDIKALCISESVLEYVRSKSGAETYTAETPDRAGITALIKAYCRTEGI